MTEICLEWRKMIRPITFWGDKKFLPGVYGVDGLLLSIDCGVGGILNSRVGTEMEDVSCISVSSSKVAALFKFTSNSLTFSFNGMEKVPSGFSWISKLLFEGWSV